jgi:hypothetical protein
MGSRVAEKQETLRSWLTETKGQAKPLHSQKGNVPRSVVKVHAK